MAITFGTLLIGGVGAASSKVNRSFASSKTGPSFPGLNRMRVAELRQPYGLKPW